MDASTDKPLIDPRLRVLYLLAIGIGVFFLRAPWTVGLLAISQAIAWLVVKLPPKRLLRQTTKLWGFALFIVVSYAITEDDPTTDRWIKVPLFGDHALSINTGGATAGAVMVLRVLAVVLASQVARAGDSRAIAAGLGKLGVPGIVSHAIDAVLALMGGGERGHGGGGGGRGGGGGGGGGGGRRHREQADPENPEPRQGFWAGVKRLAKGDVGGIMVRIDRQIGRVEEHLERQGLAESKRAMVRDVAVIAGIALVMLGIKALKILPSIPFAPGHKLVILTPLYIVARLRTRTRLGGTLTGLTMGTVAFLLGDGRYGIFEIVKHVTPGLVTDLAVPLMMAGGRKPGGIAWSILGGLIGVGRFATIFVVTLLVQPPAIAFAMLVPGLLVHSTFGVLSGYVTHQFVKATRREPDRVHESVASPETKTGQEV